MSAASIFFGDGTAAQEALLQVSGSGSKVTMTSDKTFTVGGSSGEALVKVFDGGTLDISAGKTRVDSSGIVEVGNSSMAGTMFAGQELYLQQGYVAIDHIDSQIVTDTLVIDGGVFTLKDGTVSVSSDSPNFWGGLFVGQGSGTGSLSITNGGILENALGARIGTDEGSSGSVSVSGASSLWQDTGTTSIGAFGSGQVTISNGATANLSALVAGDFPSGIGEITVNGSGSQLNNVNTILGFDGIGNLTIENGGNGVSTVTSLGASPTGIGNLVVSGVGSRWTTDSMSVGQDGTGVVQVLDGGVFESIGNTLTRVGYFKDSQGTILVSGSGSEMNLGSALILGNNGEGQFDVLAGGVVNSYTGRLAFMRDYSVGTANVSGAGSQWNVAGSLEVGTVGSAMATSILKVHWVSETVHPDKSLVLM